jgi:hypothetical protein
MPEEDGSDISPTWKRLRFQDVDELCNPQLSAALRVLTDAERQPLIMGLRSPALLSSAAARSWLIPLELKWVHGKRAIDNLTWVLSAEELVARVCVSFGCMLERNLAVHDAAA